MSNFIQFKTDRLWNYETSPYIDLLALDAIALCPGEKYLQSLEGLINTTSQEELTEDINVLFASATNDALTIAANNTLLVTAQQGDGINISYTPTADYTGVTSICLKIDFLIGLSNTQNVDLHLINSNTDVIFHTEIYTGSGVYVTNPIDIVGNQDFYIKLRHNAIDGSEVTFNAISISSCIETPELEMKVVRCDGSIVSSEFEYKITNGHVYYEFCILQDTYYQQLHIVLNDMYYSNTFICTQENKCFTSIIHYKDSLQDCYCEPIEPYYKSIRLKIAEKDCEDADEFEQYREFSTGKTRSSRAKENTYVIFTLEADKLVNDAFKSAYNSSEFYINRIRQSKIEPFSRGKRLGQTNCSITEFKTQQHKTELYTIISQFANFDNDTCNNYNTDCDNFLIH